MFTRAIGGMEMLELLSFFFILCRLAQPPIKYEHELHKSTF